MAAAAFGKNVVHSFFELEFAGFTSLSFFYIKKKKILLLYLVVIAAPGIISASPYGGAHAFPPTFAIQQAGQYKKIYFLLF